MSCLGVETLERENFKREGCMNKYILIFLAAFLLVQSAQAKNLGVYGWEVKCVGEKAW